LGIRVLPGAPFFSFQTLLFAAFFSGKQGTVPI